MRAFLICIFLIIQIIGFAKEPTLFVFSYPRSGTHWFMHCARFVMTNPQSKKFFPSKVPGGVRHSHSIRIFEENNKAPWKDKILEHDFLILIIRDFKEAMLRHFNDDYETVINHIHDDSQDQKQLKFFENLSFFDNWPSDRKLLMYYEDFLTSPKDELKRFITFIGLKQNNLSSLIKNLETHKQLIIDKYNYEHKRRNLPNVGSRSEGKDFHYHAKRVPLEAIKEMEASAKNRNLFLYNKYLKRYEYPE